MELNMFIRIPLLLIPFLIIVKCRYVLTYWITQIKLPKIVLALLISIPLIIYEERINCGAYGCANVSIPPTLWFLLILELVFFALIKILQIKNLTHQTLFVCGLGVLFELFQGASHEAFQGLFLSNPIAFVFLVLWVGLSYAFAYFLPLTIFKSLH